MMKKGLYLLLLLLLNISVNAANDYPKSCTPFAVKQASVILKTKQSVIVLINNTSLGDLWLTHPVSDPGASAGWSSRLEAGNWSALAITQGSFELSCIESKPGHEQQVSCVDVITMCKWAPTSSAKITGTSWVSENLTLQALAADLSKHGFTLPTLM